MKYWRRFRDWLRLGPPTTEREGLFVLSLIFLFLTLLIGSVMYLYRENKNRSEETRDAVVQSCRDSNEVRKEIRLIIQEIKNIGFSDPNIETVLQRYDRLTRAQALLADERCVPLRTGNELPGNR